MLVYHFYDMLIREAIRTLDALVRHMPEWGRQILQKFKDLPQW